MASLLKKIINITVLKEIQKMIVKERRYKFIFDSVKWNNMNGATILFLSLYQNYRFYLGNGVKI